MSCGAGHRCGLDPALLWLWHRPAAVALIRPLAWEPPHAVGVGLKSKKKKKSRGVKLYGSHIQKAEHKPQYLTAMDV